MQSFKIWEMITLQEKQVQKIIVFEFSSSSKNLHAPQKRPSISTLLTASSSFFMSVSSSHGFTSNKTDDLPAEKRNNQKEIVINSSLSL